MQLKGEGRAVGQQRQVKVLCIDNHASSNYACFLLARSGYKVNSASFLCDALELIHGSRYDVCLINDELVRSGKELFQKLREAAGSTPFIFYSTVVYPFSARLADQSGNTPETPVPVTEVASAVNRTIGQALPLARRAASVWATLAQRSRDA
ncbi:MAG: response regulator [Acidobacteriota bacterium]